MILLHRHLEIESFLVPPPTIVGISAANFSSRVLLCPKLGEGLIIDIFSIYFLKIVITISTTRVDDQYLDICDNLKKAESVLASQEGGDHCNHCGEGCAQVGGVP